MAVDVEPRAPVELVAHREREQEQTPVTDLLRLAAVAVVAAEPLLVHSVVVAVQAATSADVSLSARSVKNSNSRTRRSSVACRSRVAMVS